VKILAIIKKCKKVVAYIKKSSLNETLEGGTLKQEVETRWMSVIHMLKSFFPPEETDLHKSSKIIQVISVPYSLVILRILNHLLTYPAFLF
jgi:hypothetical protein